MPSTYYFFARCAVAMYRASERVATTSEEPPFNRWGRLVEPLESRGAFLRIERESGEDWKAPPPRDAIRVWHRTPGAADDDDTNNWTAWLHRPDLSQWMADYVVEEWLPPGVEPAWDSA